MLSLTYIHIVEKLTIIESLLQFSILWKVYFFFPPPPAPGAFISVYSAECAGETIPMRGKTLYAHDSSLIIFGLRQNAKKKNFFNSVPSSESQLSFL